jgi:ADP-heptose:LPS heptosyltransferase
MFPPEPGKKNDSLRIVINGGMGDHLLMTPFIKHFKKSGLYKHICCVVHQNSLELFDRSPYIDSLIPCPGNDLFLWGLPEKDFDVFTPYVDVEDIEDIHDIRTGIKSAHIFSFNLKNTPVIRQICEYYGIRLEDESLEVYTAREDEAWADGFLAEWPGKKFVYFNTSSVLENKNYPLSLWQEVVDLLIKEASDEIIILEFAREKVKLSGTIPLPFVPGLRRAAALFKRMSCIVTVDSFPGHLAAAVKTPAVVLFGPSNPQAFGHKSNINIRTSQCPACANTSRIKECKTSTCLEDITPSLIVEKILSKVASGHPAAQGPSKVTRAPY